MRSRPRQVLDVPSRRRFHDTNAGVLDDDAIHNPSPLRECEWIVPNANVIGCQDLSVSVQQFQIVERDSRPERSAKAPDPKLAIEHAGQGGHETKAQPVLEPVGFDDDRDRGDGEQEGDHQRAGQSREAVKARHGSERVAEVEVQAPGAR